MIKRINVLKHVGRFSSLFSAQGTEGDFAKFNVIYAQNACGKSTLCDVFRSLDTGNATYITGRKRFGVSLPQEIIFFLEGTGAVFFQEGQWAEHENCPPIYIYDERFVAENVFIGHHINVDQRRNLYALIIGEQAITLNNAVAFADQQLKSATQQLNAANTILDNLIPENYTIDSFKSISPTADIDDKINEATKALASAKQNKEKADAIRARKPMATLPIAEVPEALDKVLKATLDTVALAAEEKIRHHLAKTSNGLAISWTKQGFETQKGTNCPYCGQDMQGLDILTVYRSFFSSELRAQEQLRESTKATLNSAFGDTAQTLLRQILAAHQTERDWWKDAAGYDFVLPPIESAEELCSLLHDAYKAIVAALARKQENLSSEISLNDDELLAIAAWQEQARKLQNYNATLRTINENLQNQQSTAGSVNLVPLQEKIDFLNASKKRYEQQTVEAYAKYDAAKGFQETAKREKAGANDALREQSEQFLKSYGTKINTLLELFGVDFKIVSDGVSFRGGAPSGQLAIELNGVRVSATPEAASDPAMPSLANTLSGGDRSTLALAFFLAKVEMAHDVGDAIIIFDDPYHNQDRSRRQRTIESIHNLACRANQCFVFSHDLDFARTVEKCSGISKKTFELKAIGENIELKTQPLPALPSQAYVKKYNLLGDYLENPASNLHRLAEIANDIRRILEEYFKFKYPRAFTEHEWLLDIIKKIRSAQQGEPLFNCHSLVQELDHINTYSKGFHHGSSGSSADEPDSRELLTYVERTLRVIHAGGQI